MIKLNNDQTRLLFELNKFWSDPNRQYFVLSGQAGVGKTTCMRFFKDLLKKQNEDIKICMSSPTNKYQARVFLYFAQRMYRVFFSFAYSSGITKSLRCFSVSNTQTLPTVWCFDSFPCRLSPSVEITGTHS